AAMFTRIALPEMMQLGYHKGVSAGCIAAAGTFAALIPPSLTFVIFGILTGESIGALFIAGILPGLLTAAFYLGVIPFMVRMRPGWAPEPTSRATLGDKIRGMRGLWPMLALVFIVLGGIYTGITPPVGLNLFAVVSASDGRVSIGDMYVGILPFVAIELVVLLILILFPAISTYLPATMM
ncbi:MAG: TRAP transporter large permease subunit, partial [Alphaproteobacteria bacterium]